MKIQEKSNLLDKDVLFENSKQKNTPALINKAQAGQFKQLSVKFLELLQGLLVRNPQAELSVINSAKGAVLEEMYECLMN